jgi:hypothetical protein
MIHSQSGPFTVQKLQLHPPMSTSETCQTFNLFLIILLDTFFFNLDFKLFISFSLYKLTFQMMWQFVMK